MAYEAFDRLLALLAQTFTSTFLTRLVTPNGDSAMDDTNDAVRVNVVAGSASGASYTEDSAAAANPDGPVQILIRTDTPAGQVSTDGDNVARRGTNYGAALTQIITSAGAFVDTFGGGTQYTEGDTDASITGTAAMWEDASNTLRAVSIDKPLPVGTPISSTAASLTNVNDTCTHAVSPSHNTIVIMAVSGATNIGNCDLEVSYDGGSTYVTATAYTVVNSGYQVGQAQATPLTSLGATSRWMMANQNYTHVRVKCTSAGTGACAYTIYSAGLEAGANVVTSALPSGTNFLGYVGVTAVSGGTWYNEDSGHSSGDTGTFVLGVRRDADTTPVSTDGDYHALIFDNAGNLKVNVKAGSAAGTQYTEADTDASITGTAVMWEDTSDTLRAVSAAKPLPTNDAKAEMTTVTVNWTNATPLNTTATISSDLAGASMVAIQQVLNSGSPGTGVIQLQASLNGSNWVNLYMIESLGGQSISILAGDADIYRADISGFKHLRIQLTEAIDAGDITLTCIYTRSPGSMSALWFGGNASVTANTEISTATTPADNLSNAVTMGQLLVRPLVYDGSTWDRMKGDSTDGTLVNLGTNNDVTLNAGTALAGDVDLQPRTTGGLSKFKSIDLDETEEEVKGTAGKIYAMYVANLHASAFRYVKIYDNTAAGTVVGTTVPDHTIPVPSGAAGWVNFPQGISMTTGITFAATTGVADNDTGAPGANEVVVNVWYK